jgi:NDP-sugar pyrophosphorylase family protein
MDPAIFSSIDKDGKFSIIETYLEVAKSRKIAAFDHSGSIWIDLGRPENLQQAESIVDKII